MRSVRAGLAGVAIVAWLAAVALVFWPWHADEPYRRHTCGSLIAPRTWDSHDLPCMEARDTAAGWAILGLAAAVGAGAGWAALTAHQRRSAHFWARVKSGGES